MQKKIGIKPSNVAVSRVWISQRMSVPIVQLLWKILI